MGKEMIIECINTEGPAYLVGRMAGQRFVSFADFDQAIVRPLRRYAHEGGAYLKVRFRIHAGSLGNYTGRLDVTPQYVTVVDHVLANLRRMRRVSPDKATSVERWIAYIAAVRAAEG